MKNVKRLCNQELFRLYQHNRDIKTRNRIVENNLDYVKQIANSYSKKSKESFEDLFQVGVIGLIKAVESFDLNKKIKFTPYALPKIRGEILHWLRDKGHLIRIPPRYQELYQKIKKHSEKTKTTFEISGMELGFKEDTIKELKGIYSQNFNPLVDTLESSCSCDNQELYLKDIITILPKEQYFVIIHRLEGMTIKSTAEHLGIKTQDVKKIEKTAVENLKKELQKIKNI